DRFVIPAGFQGTWEVLEACRKVYVIFEAKA
ncbi:cupin domain-containing protein, partial [Escherichia coli]